MNKNNSIPTNEPMPVEGLIWWRQDHIEKVSLIAGPHGFDKGDCFRLELTLGDRIEIFYCEQSELTKLREQLESPLTPPPPPKRRVVVSSLNP